MKRDAPAEGLRAALHRLGDVREGLDRTYFVIREHHAYKYCPVGDRFGDDIGVDHAKPIYWHECCLKPEFREVITRVQDRMVLDSRGDHVVSEARKLLGEGDTLDRCIDRLCARPCEHDLLRSAAKSISHRASRPLDRPCRLLAKPVHP